MQTLDWIIYYNYLKNKYYFDIIVLVIENLPMEMRDRFTEMREMDLQVQSKLPIILLLQFSIIDYA